MTEQEWLECADPAAMLEFLRGKASERKLRLFAVACARRVWPLLDDRWSRYAIETAERYLEDQASSAELRQACLETDGRMMPNGDNDVRCSTGFAASDEQADAPGASRCALTLVAGSRRGRGRRKWGERTVQQERDAQCSLLRDIMGNPFHSATSPPAWLTPTVFSLAQGIYADRAFDRLPILADALEDAGCDSADILNHCRQPGEHVRGCWAVDLVLGRQ